MAILIDGYNVMHIVGILGRVVGPGTLQRSRLALLNFLAESLEPEEIKRAAVVFDAKDPPPGLPRTVKHRGITVHFASDYENADAQIEALIGADSAPRQLTVVSSDHRIQRAAHRRKARPVDSDAWYAEIVRRRRDREQSMPKSSARPPVPLLEEDIHYWVHQFGGESLMKDLAEIEAAETVQPPESPDDAKGRVEETSPDKPTSAGAAEFDNPFPPGYAEDLLQEKDSDDPYDPFPPGYAEDLEES